jgi:D-alanine-D-alanine ligase
VPSVGGNHDEVTAAMRQLIELTQAVAPSVHLVFVTNLRSGELRDIGPDGVDNEAQYYTLLEAEGIIRSFQSLGVTVESHFNERDFLSAAVGLHDRLHGRQPVVYTAAEGGTGSGRRALIPAVCNLLSFPVLNSGPHACSIARHKMHANAVLERAAVRVPATWMFKDGAWLGSRPARGARVIVKPTYESMAIGVEESSVCTIDDAFDALVRAKHRQFRQPVIVQEFITGEEVGVPIVRIGKTYALPVVAFRRADGSLFGSRPRTFHAENIDQDTSFALYEAQSTAYQALQEQAVAAFDALEMDGVGRIDFRIDADGRSWAFDTNESPPPMASTSYAYSMQSLGFSFTDMLTVWVGACLLEAGLISRV